MAHYRIEQPYAEQYYPQQKTSFWRRYLAYCDSKMNLRLYWYMLPLTMIACVAMPLAFFGMYLSGGNPIWFVAMAMGLLITNILVNVAELHTRITVTVYYISFIVLLLIPIFQIAANGLTIWP